MLALDEARAHHIRPLISIEAGKTDPFGCRAVVNTRIPARSVLAFYEEGAPKVGVPGLGAAAPGSEDGLEEWSEGKSFRRRSYVMECFQRRRRDGYAARAAPARRSRAPSARLCLRHSCGHP